MKARKGCVSVFLVWACQNMALAESPAPADVVPLVISNASGPAVGIWIRSEQNSSPTPWAYKLVEPQQSATINLRSADRFILVADYNGQRSRSKPVALKEFLQKHPKYVMRLRVEALEGATRGGFDSDRVSVRMGPADGQKPVDASATAADEELLDFGFVKEPLRD